MLAPEETKTIPRIGLVGGSKKMTTVYWLTPFAAAITILFNYWEIDPMLVEQFWDFFTILAGGYFGGQSVVDAVEKGVAAIRRPRFAVEPFEATTNVPGGVSGRREPGESPNE